jgi:chemotaxis protein MotB
MKPLYLQAESGSRDRWVVSYVDVLTILLVFFIAVAAKLPAKKEHAAAAVVAEKQSPRAAPDVLEKAREELTTAGVEARMEERGLVVSLPQAILFASGDDGVSEAALPVVEKIADVIRDMPNRVVLCGHADSKPIHNRRFRNNWDLSAARGVRLLELLTSRYGMDEARLAVSSDGANRPLASNETEDGRASNRRVEIVIER